MKKNRQPEAALVLNSFHFTLPGLIIFSLALIAGSAWVAYKISARPAQISEDTFTILNPADNHSLLRAGPWGELSERDVQLERPVEYLTEEVQNPQPEGWVFKGLDPAGAKALLLQAGAPEDALGRAWAQVAPVNANGVTRWQPPADFLLALEPAVRGRLYDSLAGKGINLYIDYPYIFPKNTIESIFADARLNPEDVALLKKLVYPHGRAQQMADYQALLGRIPTVPRRVAMARSLSRQTAVLVALVVHPETDLDKLAGYWGGIPNVRFIDIRPIFDAVKALPQGGPVNIIYLLPPFARNRLYTYPLPPGLGEPVMDCHWTTFNFDKTELDNRFNDPEYAIKYINQNYYPIATPSQYGDVLLLMNDKNEIKHSALFIADDLVFTKNGNNYRQPWMIMHIPDLLDTYPDNPPMRTVYLRRKVE